MRCLIFASVLLFCTQFPALAQWMVEWEQDTPLDSICGGSGRPIADGTIVQIFQDVNMDGPDSTDPLLPVCDDPPNCICGPAGTANYNTFYVNGYDPDLEMPGGFLSSWDLGYLATVFGNPDPNRIYLRVCVGELVHYVSPIYIPFAGTLWTIYDPMTVCNTYGACVADCCSVPPPAPTNFSASDSADCYRVFLTWSYPDPSTIPGDPVDSMIIYRDSCRIGNVSSADTLYEDFNISQEAPPPYRFSYFVKARRNCGNGRFAYAASAADTGSLYPPPRAATSFTASDTICNMIRFSWTFASIENIDSFEIYRDFAWMASVGSSEDHFDYHISDSTLALDTSIFTPYHIAAKSETCGYGHLSWPAFGRALYCVPVSEPAHNPIPEACHLCPNYPNPFNASTQISFDLPRAAVVSLTIFNVAGQKVATLVNSQTEAGNHTVRFNGSGFPSGVYFVRMEAGAWTSSQKMLLLK